jgi:hypothetical protein
MQGRIFRVVVLMAAMFAVATIGCRSSGRSRSTTASPPGGQCPSCK